MTPTNDPILQARRDLRKIQMELGNRISPTLSVLFNNMWTQALEKDPEGSQLKHVVEEIRELLTPMVR